MYAVTINGERPDELIHERGEEVSIRIATPAEEGLGALLECRHCSWEGERDEVGTIEGRETIGSCPDCSEAVAIPAPDPADWLNSARITIDPEDNAVHCIVSVADPRGGFALTVRQLGDGRLVMHTPHPSESLLHDQLTPRPGNVGVYGIGRGWESERAKARNRLWLDIEALESAMHLLARLSNGEKVTASEREALRVHARLDQLRANLERERTALGAGA